MISRRRAIRGAPIVLVALGLGAVAACSGSASDDPGQFSFPRVRDGHQYYLSEEERKKLQKQAEGGYTPTATGGS